MKKLQLFIAVALMIIFCSCEKENPDIVEDTGYLHGAFITNEGGFRSSNGSVSHFDQDSLIMTNNLFNKINSRPLGDVVQSITIHDKRAYIVVNNSQKVEVVNLETFSSVGLIQGLSYPRYFLGINENIGYVSNGATAGSVYVVDLNRFAIVDSIMVGSGPEQMILKDGLVYVANSGGLGIDSTLSVIDPSQDKLIETIQVGHAPLALTLDKNDDLWVLCKGKVVYGADWSIVEETDSELIRLKTGNNTIETRITIGTTGDFFWPSRMAVNSSGTAVLFTEAAGLFEMDIQAAAQPSEPLIDKTFYGFGVDPANGIIYGLNAPGFAEAGFLIRYHPDGTKIDSLTVGIAPGSVVFN